MLTSWTFLPASFSWSPFITLVIRGQDSGQCVKMNEAIQTRSARSASVIVRPERSVSRKVPRAKGRAPRSWPDRPGEGGGRGGRGRAPGAGPAPPGGGGGPPRRQEEPGRGEQGPRDDRQSEAI